MLTTASPTSVVDIWLSLAQLTLAGVASVRTNSIALTKSSALLLFSVTRAVMFFPERKLINL